VHNLLRFWLPLCYLHTLLFSDHATFIIKFSSNNPQGQKSFFSRTISVDRIYSIELEIRNKKYHSYTYVYFTTRNWEMGRFRTSSYDKRDDFDFLTVIFPAICRNNPAATAYEIYISQMIRYSRACGSYHDFLNSVLLLTHKLLNSGFLVVKLKSSRRYFYCHHHDCFIATEYMSYKWPQICSTCRIHNPVLYSLLTHHRVYNSSNTTNATRETGPAFNWVEFNPGFWWVSYCSIFSFLRNVL